MIILLALFFGAIILLSVSSMIIAFIMLLKGEK